MRPLIDTVIQDLEKVKQEEARIEALKQVQETSEFFSALKGLFIYLVSPLLKYW